MLALSILQIVSEIYASGEISFRFKIIVPVCLLVFTLAAHYSETAFFKVFAKLIACTAFLLLFGVAGYGIRSVTYVLFNETTSLGLWQGVVLLVSSAIGMYGVLKLLKSTWLN